MFCTSWDQRVQNSPALETKKGFVPVNTSPLSDPSAISCHNQLGLNQHTSTLTAQGKIVLWIRGCSAWHRKYGKSLLLFLFFPHIFFFIFYFSVMCFQLWKTSCACLLQAAAAATPSSRKCSGSAVGAVIQSMMKLESDQPHPEAAETGDMGGVWLSKQALQR